MPFSRRKIVCSLMTLPMLSLRGRAADATVFGGYELATALDTVEDGSTITLRAGNYGDLGKLLIIRGSGLTLRAEPGAVLYDTSLLLAEPGHHRVIDGLTFIGGPALTSQHDPDIHPWIYWAASTETGSFSSTLNVRGPGDVVRSCMFQSWAKGKKAIDVSAKAKGAVIESNRFRGCQPGASCAIMVGNGTATTDAVVGAKLVGNAVENCAAGSTETLSFKSSGNSMIGNMLINSNNLSNRHGSGNVFTNNRLRGSMGIVIQDGPNNVLENNVIESVRSGPGISIMAGNAEHDSHVQGDHPAAFGVTLRGNQAPLVIGRPFSSKWTVPARGTTVQSHVGTIKVMKLAQGTVLPGSGAAPKKGQS
jgi:hypothetical protein